MTTFNQFLHEWVNQGTPLRCFYCGVELLSNVAESHPHLKTKDHVIAKSRRALWFSLTGTHLPNLTVACCFTCNNIKSNRTPEALRAHVRKFNGGDVFFAEETVGITLGSLSDYLQFCEGLAKVVKQERTVQTRRSIEAVNERRRLGLLPPLDHKKLRKKAMQENDWWNAMNSMGRLVYKLKCNNAHPQVVETLLGAIAAIKVSLPEEFARREMGVKAANS